MVELWQVVYDILTNDTCVLSYVDSITGGSDSGVRRGQQPRLNTFTNCITYRQGTVTPNIAMHRGRRIPNPIFDIPMLIGVWVVEGQNDMPADVKCDRIATCITYAILGCNLNADWCTDKSVLVYDKGLDGFEGPSYYDDALKCRRQDMRFRFTAATCHFVTPLPFCEI